MSHLSRMVVGVTGLLGSVALASCAAPMPSPKMSSSSSSSEGVATCPSGTTVVGGGYEIEAQARVSGHAPSVVSSRPTETGWKVECVNGEGKTVGGCRAFVLCASIL